MHQIVVDQKLILLDGKPLALVTPSGLAQWEHDGVKFTCRYDQIIDEGDNYGKFRCLYEREGTPEIFVLVESPSSPEGFGVILVDHPPRTLH